jgi:uncharacterized protein YjbI with pentapeptide repeats/uncharacterized RDD family membrane protein YckC
MATTTPKKGKRGKKTQERQFFEKNPRLTLPMFSRRFAAWLLEISLLGTTVVVPYGIGTYLNTNTNQDLVPLDSVLTKVEAKISETLALPRRFNQTQKVAPLTNIFWWIALVSPAVLTAGQFYLLAKTGQTYPKRWLGLRVVSNDINIPGWGRIISREAFCRWGIPLSTTYVLWRYSGLFPDLIMLAGVAFLAVVAEAGIVIFSPNRRTLHELLSGTQVVDGQQPLTTRTRTHQNYEAQNSNSAMTLEVQSLLNDPIQQVGNNPRGQERVTTIVLTTKTEGNNPKFGLWSWMLRNPGLTLLICALAGMGSVLGTFIGAQIYAQNQADRRQNKQENNEVFLSLVNRLSATSTDPMEERRSVILTLAQLDDRRAVSLLVDLLGQEKNDSLVDTLQQAVSSVGPKALPHLRSLNQSLENELKALGDNNNWETRNKIALRLKATKQAIVKLLTIHSGKFANASLQDTDLGSVNAGVDTFKLVLEKVDLSGLNLRGTNLRNANLQGSIFASAGKDKNLGTFDDWLVDLSGADLKEANLQSAILTNISIDRTNLIRANLNRANLAYARLIASNLSSAQLLEANLEEANLENASLTGADLGNVKAKGINLQGALLGQIKAIDANFSSGKLFQSNWQGSELTDVNFSKANLQQADLSGTKLQGANLQEAQLENATLAGANLSGADLRQAKLNGANFQNVVLAGNSNNSGDEFLQSSGSLNSVAKFQGVDFSEVQNLDNIQIELICKYGGIHTQCRR